MTDEQTPDVKSEKVEEKAPVVEPTGEASKAQAPSNIPEKFQGKSPEEIVKMYSELEKKFGEHTDEVKSARQYLQEREILNQAIAKNPELYKLLEKEITGMYNKPSDGDGEVKADPRVTELRKHEENRIITDFQKEHGIHEMKPDDRNELMKKVSQELAEMLDPGGSKSVGQIISEVSISKLPKMLENAYWLANKEKLVDRGEQSPDMASIGSISYASSGKSDRNKLTEHEKSIAQKLGVSEEKYLKNKLEINK